MAHISPAPHEFAARIKYHLDGASPYWQLTSILINGFDGGVSDIETQIRGETWTLSMGYKKGGIAPRLQDDIASERLYQVKIHAEGDGERKADYEISPRWPDMRHFDTGETLGLPWQSRNTRLCQDHNGDTYDPEEAVDVFLEGSNLHPDDYVDLLPEFVQALAREAGMSINTRYFTGHPHPASRITAYERYVRITRSMAKKVHGTSGVLFKILHLLADERDVRFSYHVDNEDVVGKMHRLILDRASVPELWRGHSYGRQVKTYLLKNPDAVSEDDPSFHPKVGILVDKQKNDGQAIHWTDRDRLERELDESLINVLAWSDVPVSVDPTTYVADDHFHVEPRDEPLEVFADPTPELEAEQEHLLLTVLDDMTLADRDIVEALADGGTMHVDDVAQESGRAVSTVYRALQRLSELIESDNGTLHFRSQKLRDEVQQLVNSLEYQIDNAADRAAKIVGLDRRAAATSAVENWLAKYAAELDLDDDGTPEKLRIDTILGQHKYTSIPKADEVLHDFARRWQSAGHDATELRDLQVEYKTGPDATADGIFSAIVW